MLHFYLNLGCIVTAHQESLHCACAHRPRQSQTSVHKLVAERLPRELSYTVGETKVSVIPLSKSVSVEPASPFLPKIILRLQVYTSTIRIMNLNCKVLSKNKLVVQIKQW